MECSLKQLTKEAHMARRVFRGERRNLVMLAASAIALGAMSSASAAARPTEPEVKQHLGVLALPFVANDGQLDARVAYYANTFDGTVFVTRRGEIVFALPGKRGAVAQSFVGGHAKPVATQPATARVSVFRGNDPARWRSQVPTYAAMSLGEVYPGVAVSLEAYGKQVEQVFTVAPRAVVGAIRIRARGAESLRVRADGVLAVRTNGGEVRLTRPVAYQMVDGKRRHVDVAYRVSGNAYGFRVGRYDPRRPLVIDPLIQATYLGGATDEDAFPIAVNPTTGEVYVAGSTGRFTFDVPGTAGGAQPTPGGGDTDSFVARLNPALTALDQATYLGGSGHDQIGSIAFAPVTGEVYVAGNTNSTDFPGTSGGAQPMSTSLGDGFVARLSPTLTALDQATYLGGNDLDGLLALALNPTTGEVYVAGYTDSDDFPGTAGGAEPTLRGAEDAFVARLNPALTTLDQATYFGADGSDGAAAIVIEPTTGEVYVAGSTDFSRSDLPGTAGGAQPRRGKASDFEGDGFVARFAPTLTSLDQATYLGGSSWDSIGSIVLHPTTGEVYVAGITSSANFPGVAGGAQPAIGGSHKNDQANSQDVFVARLNPALTALDQATFLGGSRYDAATRIAREATTGEIYVAGTTRSIDFPGTGGGLQPLHSGSDVYLGNFIARLNPELTAIDQATYLDDERHFLVDAMALKPTTGDVYIAGVTGSVDLPGTAGGAQPTYGGGAADGFVALLSADLRGSCGNGVLETGEQCDDGNLVDGDTCPRDCAYTIGKLAIRGNARTPSHDKTGCQVEWYVANPGNPLDRFGVPRRKQVCADQDPSCDYDATLDRCRFEVVACASNGAAGTRCEPSGLSTVEVRDPKPAQGHTPAEVAALTADAAAVQNAFQNLLDPADPGAGYTATVPIPPSKRYLCSAPFAIDVLKAGSHAGHVKVTVRSRDGSLPARTNTSKLQFTCLR
jgi:cysteine-rich repeat protein